VTPYDGELSQTEQDVNLSCEGRPVVVAVAGLTSECLDQCPAEDDLDFACAVHDFCYGLNDYEEEFPGFECTSRTSLLHTRTLTRTDRLGPLVCSQRRDFVPLHPVLGIQKSGPCECDCRLVKTARTIDDSNDFYRSALIFTFTHITNCWYGDRLAPSFC
jgi:hypothetical protein